MSGLNYGSTYHLSRNERPLNNGGKLKKPVYVFNENEQFIKKYDSIQKCIDNEKIALSTLKKHIRHKTMFNKKYYSYENYLNPNTNAF